MKTYRWLAGILIIFVVLFSGGQTPASNKGKENDNLYKELRLFANTLEIVRKQYVDVDKVSAKKLIYGALRGMLASLGPHSQFMGPDLYKELQIQSQGYFGGLGMVVTLKNNFLTVISPLKGTPAFRAGIKAGDMIIKVEGKSTKDMTLMEAVNKLRGPAGTPVTITVIRNRKILPDITLTRQKIELPAVQDTHMIEGGIGYIRLVEFRAGAAKELQAALRKLQGEGLKGLILDLRNNPGGLLEEGVAVASEFLPEGKLIVSTRGRTAESDHKFFSRDPNYTNIPLVLLVNGFSASASEILSGAMQDWKRAIIIGTKTYGKASVQTVIPLGDGSALRLTTAKYFTPKGRDIHKTKIVPDIIVKERQERGEMSFSPPGIPPNKGKEKKPGKKEAISDPQLKEAVNILKAWPIFKSIYSLEENKNAK